MYYTKDNKIKFSLKIRWKYNNKNFHRILYEHLFDQLKRERKREKDKTNI